MTSNSQLAYLNSALKSSGSPVTLSRLLVEHYIHLESAERDQFVLALIMELGARQSVAMKPAA